MPAKQPDNTIVAPIMRVVAEQGRRVSAKPSDKSAGDQRVAEILDARQQMIRRARRYPEPPWKPAA
jgi:hypothetical protein